VRFTSADVMFVYRTSFSVAASAISISVPAWLVVAHHGGQPLGVAGASDFQSVALPVAVLVAGYSLLNTRLVATILALASSRRIVAAWRENFAWVPLSHVWSALAAAAVAVYAAYVNLFSIAALLGIAAAAYATIRLYLRQVEESTGRAHKLNDLYLATIG